MTKSVYSTIIFFILAILFTILVMPYLPIFLRPNLILAFIILCSFHIGFQKSIWHWIIGGILLDNFTLFKLPVNSIIFISLFIVMIIFSKTFDYTTQMSKMVTSYLLISLYYISWFFINWIALQKVNWLLFLYLIETLLAWSLMFKLTSKTGYNEKALHII